MPIAQTKFAKHPSGTTVFSHGDAFLAQGSETTNFAEASLFTQDGGATAGPFDVSQFNEAVLITNCTSIGTSATFTVKLYGCDSLGNRVGAALVTKTITTTGSTRDTVAAPIGSFLDVTKTQAGIASGTTTCSVELQLKTH